MNYDEFLHSKVTVAPVSGFTVKSEEVNPALKPHQRDAVIWACKGGRRALFESFGLGKTAQELEFCRLVLDHEGGRALITLPLGVRQEFSRDAEKLLHMDPPVYVRTMAEVEATDAKILMANTVSKGTMFPEEVVSDLFNKVMGKSSLAALSEQIPIAFNGNDIFTFSMDDEVNIVGENEAKGAGSVTVAPVKVVPVKIEYGSRFSDEFLYAAEEKKLEVLKAFNDGFSKKVARGIDIMAMHGVNPRTGTASALITQYFDKGAQTVPYAAATADENVEDAITLIGDYDVTGIAMAKTFAAAMGKLKNSTCNRRV